MIEVDDIQLSVDERDQNAQRFRRHDAGEGENQCFVCGRFLSQGQLDRGWHIHLVEGGSLICEAEDESYDETPGDMYWFPVGPE